MAYRRWSATEIGIVTDRHLAGDNDTAIAAALNELAEARDVKRTARQVYLQRRVAGLGIKWPPHILAPGRIRGARFRGRGAWFKDG